MFKKRGVCKLVVFFLLMLALAVSVYGEETGYCSNPIVQGVCQDNSITKSTCCPDSFEGYGSEGYPEGKNDCVNNFFGSDASSINNCEMGSCFIDGQPTCLASTYFATCYAQGGEPSTESISENEDCKEGCCCYVDGEDNESTISTQSYCEDKSDYNFHSDIDNSNDCQDQCNVEKADEGEGSGEDEGEDEGETSECGSMPYCEPDAGELSGSCCCDGAVCEAGEYCCGGSCYDVPCDETCEQAQPCGKKNEQGCPLFQKCLPNGTLAENCTSRPSCGDGFEVCDTPEDDNNNGKTNCQEAFCSGMVCAKNEEERSENCPDNSYYDANDDVYRCCYGLELNDCADPEGVVDTCGECDCLKHPRAPVLDPINVQRGQRGVNIRWHLNCEGVEYRLMRCEGSDCEDNSYNLRAQTQKRTFFDEGIQPNTKYCYYVNALYPNAGEQGRVIKKSEKQCFTSGDEVCMEVSEGNFCLDETKGFGDELVLRATCMSNNTLFVQENCLQSRGQNYVCKGPFPPYGQTRCVFQSPCEDCGDPFGMFADYASSSTIIGDQAPASCRSAPTCYYDFTSTSVDNFRDCSQVQTCFDYKSKFACEGQPSTQLETNNKCLPRDCEWKSIEDNPKGGICMEKSDEYMDCSKCNEAEYNDVLGACDAETCSMFGECYLRSSADYKCVSKDKISCKDYQTKNECTGGSELEIDVKYNNMGGRTEGTNAIKNPSGDKLGFGVCRWNASKNPSCFKDANFDSFQDPTGGKLTFDRTPPNTTILSTTQARDLNITFEVTDYNPDGSKGSGVRSWNVYFCKTKAGEDPCYPDKNPAQLKNNKGWINLGGGSGEYNVYYYAMDKAGNLEKVKKKRFEIDMSAPEIDISYDVQEDTEDYTNSKISFLVNTSENTHCWDDFEGQDPQMTGDAWGDKWTTLYSGLDDGYYEYKVVCRDRAGNKGKEIVTVRVNADAFIDKTAPRGKIAYSDVKLQAYTIKETSCDQIECKWGPNEADYNQLPNGFSGREATGNNYCKFTSSKGVDESKTYSYDVKCKNTQSGRVSDDEIQFVYDNKAPETNVVDRQNNKFDFSSWYSGQQTRDKLFLSCNDSPENGFGCDKTFYCVDYNNEPCNPEKEIEEDEPLKADFSESEKFRICYRSKEKTINEMGGKYEEKVCKEMQIDTNPPYVNIEELKSYTTPDQPKEVNKRFYTLKGEVVDPDVVNDEADNTLDLVVQHKKSGNSTVYEDIEANPGFTKEINLEKELNVITLFAEDRSGATSGPVKYYIFYSPYEGNMISLSRPAFGVSSSPEFIFEVETFSEGSCRYSLSGEKNNAIEMVSYNDGDKHLHKSEEKLDFGWLKPTKKHTVSVYCNFKGGYNIKQNFKLSWDDTKPKIKDIYLEEATDKGGTPTIVEFPLKTNLVVETDDETICKYTNNSGINYHSTKQKEFPGYDSFNFSTTNKVLLDDLKDKKDYKFYIQCENGVTKESISLSRRRDFEFRVDTTKDTGIRLLSPEDPTRQDTFSVKIKSTRSAEWCNLHYGEEEYNMTNEEGRTFSSPSINASKGENEFKVSCLTAKELAERNFEIVVDTTPPLRPQISDGNDSVRLDSLSATWSTEDEETDVELYKYSIGSMPGSTDVVGWRNTTDENANVAGLNLTEGETYYWQVKAQNEVGLWGNPNVSDGVFAGDRSNIQKVDKCSNGKLDGEETDVDCGGPECPACSFNATCELDSDCASGVCEEGLCAKPSCNDNVSNQDETGVDCGGSCEPCSIGSGCSENKDCKTGFCKYGECVEPTCSDGFKNQGEEGVDCGGPCNESCESNESEACEVQYGPMKGKKDSDCDGLPDEWEMKYSEQLNPNNPDDASEDPDGDGRTNIEEYRDNTNPLKAEEKEEEGSAWLLILILILVLLGLLVAFVWSYRHFYDKIPPKYRKYLDVVLQPVLKKIDELKQKIAPYINQVRDKIMGKPEKVTAPPVSQQGPHRKSASFTGSKAGEEKTTQGTTPTKGKQTASKVSVDESGYDASTTKELVQQIRNKRQKKKKKQREEVVSEFDQDKKKSKRKGLLDKVEQEFGGSKKK